MKLFLISLVSFLFVLLSRAELHDDEFNLKSCPTARRLLFFGGLTFPLIGGKKSGHVSSSSSPPKYARSATTHGLTVYIHPQTSSELGHKARSYSHLLKSKLFTKEEQAKLKKLKKTGTKKKEKTPSAPKTRDLVAVNDEERDRCRALLQIDHQNSLVPAKQKKQMKKVKNSVSTKVKNITEKAKKQAVKTAKALLIEEKVKPKKSKAPSKEKVKPTKNKDKTTPSETTVLTPAPPVVKQKPSSPPPPLTTPPPPPTKSKREKAPPPPPPKVVEESTDSLDETEQDEIDNEDKNNDSVVGRAYSFVKNMFQLSDDILENNHTHEEDSILSSPNEQSNRHSRKLLSILDDISFAGERIIKRQLLSVKASKHSTSQKKEKKTHSNEAKPKVGWAYRYRISRYLADQKTKRSGQTSKSSAGGGKSKQQAKVPKRKLLGFAFDDALNSDDDQKSNPEIVDTVTVTEQFVPKRQLLGSKKRHEETDDEEKVSERRRMKSFDDITDPVEIVRSYDRGLFKPRVGWQFRYRVSRYIDSLRDNIREDQQRLKLGLEAIKRKTPQELSGRRKRVLDKPFAPEPEETLVVVEDNKPNVGWRYRYRISKMLDAKQRGEYVDDEELKRQARLGQKQKGPAKPVKADDECIEWEFDLDPELRKVSEEGKRVGWAYRYRIRRKLDELKQRQAETGVAFDVETLGGQREKKATRTAIKATTTTEEKPDAETNKKAVGWQYRYRVSKMLEAQKREGVERSSKAGAKKQEQVAPHERLDPALARLKPEERVVGWAYRYRIRRKLDALKNESGETGAGRRGKKDKQLTGKRKEKEEIGKKIEESIEKILNIDDIDETPFMEYFRRSSSYVLFGLLPTMKRSVCLLAAPGTFAFCEEEEDQNLPKAATTTQPPRVSSTKKLRTKKEKQAKQFIQSRSSKLDSFDELIDQPVKPLSKVPKRVAKKPKTRSAVRRQGDELVRHFDEEEQPVKKLIGVESKKKNRKRFQIIGQEVKVKPKHTTPSPPPAPPTTTVTFAPKPQVIPTTTSAPRVVPTTPAPQATTTTTTPAAQVTTTTTTPAPQVITTTSAPLRTISEIIQEEADTLLSTATTFVEETKEEINEANEIAQSTPATKDDSTSGSESDDEDDESEDEESSSSDSDSDSNEENKEQTAVDDDFDPLAVKKMKKMYENTKESVHGVFDLKDEHDSS